MTSLKSYLSKKLQAWSELSRELRFLCVFFGMIFALFVVWGIVWLSSANEGSFMPIILFIAIGGSIIEMVLYSGAFFRKQDV